MEPDWSISLFERLDAAAADGLPAYGVLQPEYNLYARSGYEGELRDLCIAEGLGVIPYFALASGFLTGKYRSPEDAAKSPRGERIVDVARRGAELGCKEALFTLGDRPEERWPECQGTFWLKHSIIGPRYCKRRVLAAPGLQSMVGQDRRHIPLDLNFEGLHAAKGPLVPQI